MKVFIKISKPFFNIKKACIKSLKNYKSQDKRSLIFQYLNFQKVLKISSFNKKKD
jgi:hypothetical protein